MPLSEQAEQLRRWMATRSKSSRPRTERLVAVTGGKGGVGKSNFSLNFSLALRALERRVLLVDCDTGLGNIDVLLGLCPTRHLGSVLAGECQLGEAISDGPAGLHILPAASGIEALGRATGTQVKALMGALGGAAGRYDVVVLDTGAGLGPQVRALLRAAPEILVVTTPEPTALADAYATLKVLRAENPRAQASLVINLAESMRDAEQAAAGVTAVAERYLGWRPDYLGAIPRDPGVVQAVRHQRPFLLWSPNSPASRAVKSLAAAWLQGPEGDGPAAGERRGGLLTVFWSYWNQWRGAGATEGVAGRG
jgi:flagellar biosynthesis protein FlhG